MWLFKVPMDDFSGNGLACTDINTARAASAKKRESR